MDTVRHVMMERSNMKAFAAVERIEKVGEEALEEAVKYFELGILGVL